MAEKKEITVEEKLKKLYDLQKKVSKIDALIRERIDLPIEEKEMEDEIEGLRTRAERFESEIDRLANQISDNKVRMAEAGQLIEKYRSQLDNVRNNREYENLSKEIEWQSLDMEHCEKRIKEFEERIEKEKEDLERTHELIKEREADLELKKQEMESLIATYKEEEDKLGDDANRIEAKIGDERLLNAFRKIRKNALNGLGIVPVRRSACGGCFNRIPPQRVADIKQRKRIIVCEYCGRILVDPELVGEKPDEIVSEKPKKGGLRLKTKAQ